MVPQALRGVNVKLFTNATAAGTSAGPFCCTRVPIKTVLVGDLICVTFDGSVPFHPGPVMAKFPDPFPVVRGPGDANTFDHASKSDAT